MSQRELRVLDTTDVRALGGSGDSDPLRIEGYAAVFNRSAKLPGFEERIKPGAFTRSIEAGADVVCLLNHNSDFPLGRTTAGTLRLNQDARGLHFVCDLPNTQVARDTHELIRTKSINGCSFGFMVEKDGQIWSEGKRGDGTWVVQRELTNFARLTDVSPVCYPCYEGTAVSARSAEVPAELRSSVDMKNAALIVPPAIEKRPYSNVSEVPDSVPKDKRKQWMEVWNSAYKKALKDGKAAKDAESSAFAQANGVVKESKSMPADKIELRAVTGIDGFDLKPQDCPASWSDEMKQSYCDGYNAAYDKGNKAGIKGEALSALAISGGMMGIHEMMTLPAESGTPQPENSTTVDTDLDNDEDELQPGRAAKDKAEKRDDSIEDFLQAINQALASQFPYPTENGPMAYPSSKYYSVETFEDHVIVCCPGPDGEYLSIPYVIAPDSDGDADDITFGTPVPVEKDWVLTDRAKAFVAELRDEFNDNEDDDDEEDDDFADDFGLVYAGRQFDDSSLDDGHDDMDCEDGECDCQNRFCPSSSGMRSELPAGVSYRFADNFTFELRAGMTRTKRVAGKDLSAASFAYVGDADKTETWKFPIFDAAHVRNALARFTQADLPADAKAGVKAKIDAAAKKFGVTVSDERSAEEIKDAELRARIAEHMLRVGPDFDIRYSPDQPRDDRGRFGAGTQPSSEPKSAHPIKAGHFVATTKGGKYNNDHGYVVVSHDATSGNYTLKATAEGEKGQTTTVHESEVVKPGTRDGK